MSRVVRGSDSRSSAQPDGTDYGLAGTQVDSPPSRYVGMSSSDSLDAAPQQLMSRRSGINTISKVALALAICIAGVRGYFIVHEFREGFHRGFHEANRETTISAADRASLKGTELGPDGRSNLPGGSASLKYTSGLDDFETVFDANAGGGPHDAAAWSVRHWTQEDGRPALIELRHLIFVPRVDSQGERETILGSENADNSAKAGRHLRPRQTRIGGRRASTWSFNTTDGRWVFEAIFLAKTHSYVVSCSAPNDDARVFKRHCLDAVNSIKFKVAGDASLPRTADVNET